MAHGPDTKELLKMLEQYDYKNPITRYFYEKKNLFIGQQLRITSLPPLPPRLESLTCLPKTIQFLPELPPKLKNLICSNMKIRSLPALPETLEYLDCGDTLVESLPKLPPNLRILFCDGTSISELPELPDSLEELYCQNIKELHTLPKLPDRLRVLFCKNSHIDTIKPSETVKEYIKRLNEYFEEQASKKRIQERVRLLKEDLAMEAWKPERMEKWLDVGYDPDD